ncbi:MAG: coproporphyrinogen dehydrogenase HemZ [Eubacteriales bacterium]
MPVVKMIGHDYAFPIADVLRLFFGECSRDGSSELSAGSDSDTIIYSKLSGDLVSTWIEGNEDRLCCTANKDKLPVKREVKRQLYLLLSNLLDRKYPWGSLTGIRPTVVAREVKSARELSDKYFVREDKALLAMETAAYEDRILESASPDLFCGYIGVPFCRSRCSYCSFISQDAASQLNLLVPYAEAVCLEIDSFAVDNPLGLSCLYVGGGTPTVFDNDTFRRFLGKTFISLGADKIPEITVEAGRPDTITDHKLRTLKDLGVHRICINPQTLSDKTLVLLGRNHSVDDFYRAYDAARKIGFMTINTDLIAGLPEEHEEDFIKSLEGVLSLEPENITVHTLSIKKKADIAQDMNRLENRKELKDLDEMLRYADARLKAKGYLPYYLYKQKDTLGGHENTGYTKNGHACIYNVAMMSDQRSIIAFGAGSVSKRTFIEKRLQRCPNVRNPHEYIDRAEEMARRKRGFFGV